MIDAQLLLTIHGGDKHNARRETDKGIEVLAGGLGEGLKQMSAEVAFRNIPFQIRGLC